MQGIFHKFQINSMIKFELYIPNTILTSKKFLFVFVGNLFTKSKQ